MFFELKDPNIDCVTVIDFYGDYLFCKKYENYYLYNLYEKIFLKIDYVKIAGEILSYFVAEHKCYYQLNLKGKIEKDGRFRLATTRKVYGKNEFSLNIKRVLTINRLIEYKNCSFVGHYIRGENFLIDCETGEFDQILFEKTKNIKDLVLSKDYLYNGEEKKIFKKFDLKFLQKKLYKDLDKILKNLLLCLKKLNLPKLPKYLIFKIFEY